MKKKLLTLLLLIACFDLLQAQTEPQQTLCCMTADPVVNQPITSTLSFSLGQAKVRNSYLTPLLYTGAEIGVGYDRMHDWRIDSWMSLQTLEGRFTTGDDRGSNSGNWSGRLGYRYAAMYRWPALFTDNLSLCVGPFLGAETGFDYNLKMASSNNPATARIAANAGVSLMSSYEYRLFGSRRSVATLLLQAPLVGYAFMPEYGASYYETFYLDATENNHHFTSLHNQQDLSIRLTTDIPLLRRSYGAIRLGCAYHIETMDINQVTTRFSAFEAVIGWTFRSVRL